MKMPKNVIKLLDWSQNELDLFEREILAIGFKTSPKYIEVLTKNNFVKRCYTIR